jgi:putative ABC transport system permease protein
MTNTDIGLVGVALSGLLVLVAIGLSLARRLGLEGSIAFAAIRAALQLLLVGVALGLVVKPDAPLIYSGLWVAAMIVYASVTLRRRAPEVPGALGLGMGAFSAATVVVLGVLFGLGVFPANGRTIVPLAGMLIGNGLNATILAARRIVGEAADQRATIEGRLALGLSSRQAFQPHLRSALRTALIPQVETTKAVGIVFLPGAMVGLILAGVDPANAVKIQAAVMYLVLGSVAITTSVVALGLTSRLFTPDHRLIRIARTQG